MTPTPPHTSINLTDRPILAFATTTSTHLARIACGSANHSAYTFPPLTANTTPTNIQKNELYKHNEWVTALLYIENNIMLVTAGSDGQAYAWRGKTARALIYPERAGNAAVILSGAIASPITQIVYVNKILYFATYQGTILQFDMDRERERNYYATAFRSRPKREACTSLCSVMAQRDGEPVEAIAALYKDGALLIHHIDTDRTDGVQAYKGQGVSLTLYQNQYILALGHEEEKGILRMFDPTDSLSRPIKSTHAHKGALKLTIAICPFAESIFATAGKTKIKLWNSESRYRALDCGPMTSESNSVVRLYWSSQGLVSGWFDGRVLYHRLPDLSECLVMATKSEPARVICDSHPGSVMDLLAVDGFVYVARQNGMVDVYEF